MTQTVNPLPDDKFLDSSKLKEFVDDNFKFDENGRKLSKQVENTVGKGEIARYKQFLLFPQCFQKACFPGASKGVIMWEWIKVVIIKHGPTFYFEIIIDSKHVLLVYCLKLPSDKVLARSNLKLFAENKLKMAKIVEFVLENIVGRG